MYANPDMFGMRNITNNWDDFRLAFGSFDQNEKPRMTFEYKKVTPWGEAPSNDQIIDNYLQLQAAFRERGEKF